MTKRPSGFTLLEIMVALTVGGIALGSLYSIGAASTRHFREQQRISAAQTSLRSAMEQIKHDLQRAGFLGTPSTLVAGEICAPVTSVDTANQFAAIAGYRKRVTPLPTQLDPSGLNSDPNDFSVDQLWVMGNYATSGEYANIALGSDNKTITLPNNWQSFRRDFTLWTGSNAGNCDTAAFSAAFPPGRIVRLHSLNGGYFYAKVSSTTCTGTAPATIVLVDQVPAVCNMNGGWISPLGVLRYRVENGLEAEGASDKRMTVLRRAEVKPESRDTILTLNSVPTDDRALLDYVVHFSIDFMLAASTGSAVMDYGLATQTAVLSKPQAVRGAVIDIAVRTSQQEPDFTSDIPRQAFRVYSQRGAARVRRAHAEVLLTNIANRGLN